MSDQHPAPPPRTPGDNFMTIEPAPKGEATVPVLAPSLAADLLRANASLSLAALALPDLPHDGVQVFAHADLRSGSATVGGVVEFRDWHGGVLATRHADGRWTAGAELTWTWKD